MNPSTDLLAIESLSGDIFISDAYEQQRVHKFSQHGHLIHSWGYRGRGLGQFARPYNICVDREEQIDVADRTNCRIGIFNSEGDFLDQWIEFAYPNEIYMDKNNTIYVAESGLGTCETEFADAGRISILNAKGEVQGRFQSRMAHGMRVDSKDNIYVTHLVLGITKYAKNKE